MVGKWFGFEREEVFEEGLSCFEKGDFEEASKAFEACQADDPSDLRFQSYLLTCYEEIANGALAQKNYVHAAAMVEHAIALSPNRPDLHLIAARAFKAIRKLSLARFHLHRAAGLRDKGPRDKTGTSTESAGVSVAHKP